MNEFELGREFAQLSNRISQIESRMQAVSSREVIIQPQTTITRRDFGEVLTSNDVDEISDDLTFDDVDEINDDLIFNEAVNVKAGDCPASFEASWRNKYVETDAFYAVDKASAEKKAKKTAGIEAINKLMRKASGLDCSSRPGCANPVTCKEKIIKTGPIKGIEKKWICKKTGDTNEAGDPEWKCSRHYTINAKHICECKK
ncbi:MAG: hypothetical protein AAGB19_20385 [Cyanobacteria bacterium P01_F01_bin.3]